MIDHTGKARNSNERGAALVEYSLVAAIFVAVLVMGAKALEDAATERATTSMDIVSESGAGDSEVLAPCRKTGGVLDPATGECI